MQKVREVAERIAAENNARLDTFIRLELIRLVSECIQSGDFVRYLGPASTHAVAYIPYYEAERLREKLRLVKEYVPPDVLTNLQQKGIFMPD